MHPAARIMLAFCFVLAALNAKAPVNYSIAGLGILYSFSIKSRSGFNPAKIFAKMLLFGIVILFLMHGLNFHTRALSTKGLRVVADGALRFASVFAATLWLVKGTTKEELYALMLSVRMPIAAILVVFRAIWFLPHIFKRVRDVLLAHRLRGLDSSNFFRRCLALAPALHAIFASMVLEICESSVVMVSKGIWIGGPKSSSLQLRWSCRDWIAAGAAGLVIVILLFKGTHLARG